MTEKKNPSLADLMGEEPVKEAAANTGIAPILTDEEIEAAKKVARENVEKALRDAALKKIVAEEEERLKRLEGQRTGVADMDEEVDIFIDLAEFADRITVNMVDYFHGYHYKVPRHVANGLREIMQRTYRHQMEIDGKSLDETYRRTAPVALSPSGQRPLSEEIAA